MRSKEGKKLLNSQSKKQSPRKRLEVTDGSGWTHVVKGRASVLDASILTSPFQVLQRADKIPLELVAENHARCLDLWKASDCWNLVADFLENTILSSRDTCLTSCVCLGLGSLSGGRQSSRYELAALVSILQLLGKTHSIKNVVFQDPAFNEVDEAFLTHLGYRVVSTPSGFESVDQNTFCFAPHLEHEIFAMAIKTAHPAICIGNSDLLSEHSLNSSVGDSNSTLDVFHPFLEATNSKMMPVFDQDTWCQFTSIYWLREDAI